MGTNVLVRPLRGKVVLVVDGDEDVRDALTFLLVVLGADAVAAPTSREALHEASHRPIYALVSELSLPDGRGSDLLRALRRVHRAALGLAITSSVDPADEIELRGAGFDQVLHKPVHPVHVIQALSPLSRPQLP